MVTVFELVFFAGLVVVVEALVVFLTAGLALVAVFVVLAAGLAAGLVALVGAFVDLDVDAGLAFYKRCQPRQTNEERVETDLLGSSRSL